MEFDPRTDRLPFNEPDEAEATRAGVTEPSHDARIRHLQRVPLFSGFSDKEFRRIAELSRIVDVPAGSAVTQIGEPGDSFFVIIDGTVAVRTPVGTGAQLHPGEFFGEMSLLEGEPRSATIVATTDLRLLVVDRSHFWQLLDGTPDLIRRSGGCSRSSHVACDVSSIRYTRYSMARIRPDAPESLLLRADE